MRAMRAATIALLSLLAPVIAPSWAQSSDPAAAPLSLASLLSPQSQFPVPRPSRPFVCENAGFLREHLPLSFVADGVCDCCDGADERVAGGLNPFFPADHDDARQQQRQLQQAEQEKRQEDTNAPSGGGGGGWLQGLLGGSGDATAGDSTPSDASPSPCPNSCASRALDFLSSMQHRVDEYAAGVDAKALRMRGMGALNKRLRQEAKELQASLASTAESFRAAQAAHTRSASEQSRNMLRFLQQRGSQLQFELEHLRWLLGHAVPSPHKRQAARPAGDFGAQREWLLLWERCFEYAWPQRRFGAFGEHVDWYLMRLCPLANATQTAMTSPPKREGSRWREAEAETDSVAAESGADVAAPTVAAADDAAAPTERHEEEGQQAQEEKEEEEPQQWSLGWWSGHIVDEQQQQQQDDGDSSTASAPAPLAPASSAPAGSVASSAPDPLFLLPLRDGDPCWQVGPRQVDVSVRCGRADEIVGVREDGKCRYRMEFVTPLACSRDHLDRLRQQLDAHRRWFARRPPPPSLPRSVEQMLHDEL